MDLLFGKAKNRAVNILYLLSLYQSTEKAVNKRKSTRNINFNWVAIFYFKSNYRKLKCTYLLRYLVSHYYK